MDEFIVLTPARNEVRHLPGLMVSVGKQTKRPLFWVVIDDGSTDGTGDLVDHADRSLSLERLPLVNHRPSIDRYFHVVSSGITYALAECRKRNYRPEFVSVLDADVSLPPDYFEEVTRTMAENKKIGICSGVMYEKEKVGFRPFVDPWGRFIVSGAAVTYRLSCLEAIGGYPQTIAGDSVVLCRATATGWTASVTDKTRFYHLRPESTLNRRISMGRHYFSLGYHPLAALLTTVYYCAMGPNRLSGPGFWVGYSVASLMRFERVTDAQVLDAYGKRRVTSIVTSSIARARGSKEPR